LTGNVLSNPYLGEEDNKLSEAEDYDLGDSLEVVDYDFLKVGGSGTSLSYSFTPTPAPSSAPTPSAPTPGSGGDPHIAGFNGQDFTFYGEHNKWFSLISEERLHINMRTGVFETGATWIKGWGFLLKMPDSSVRKILIDTTPSLSCDTTETDVEELDYLDEDITDTCIAGGIFYVEIDGIKIKHTGYLSLPGMNITISNLPYECKRPFVNRELQSSDELRPGLFGDNVNDPEACKKFQRTTDPFRWNNKYYASARITTSYLDISLEASRVVDSDDILRTTDIVRYDSFFDAYEPPENAHGVLGQTATVKHDKNGKAINLVGEEKDYEVKSWDSVDFKYSVFRN
jgi:hypothetical protein